MARSPPYLIWGVEIKPGIVLVRLSANFRPFLRNFWPPRDQCKTAEKLELYVGGQGFLLSIKSSRNMLKMVFFSPGSALFTYRQNNPRKLNMLIFQGKSSRGARGIYNGCQHQAAEWSCLIALTLGWVGVTLDTGCLVTASCCSPTLLPMHTSLSIYHREVLLPVQIGDVLMECCPPSLKKKNLAVPQNMENSE